MAYTTRVTKNIILKWNIIQHITKELTIKWNINSAIRNIVFPGTETPSQPKMENVTEKRSTPNWWRGSWYTHNKTRRSRANESFG